jgi:hypothetical protein
MPKEILCGFPNNSFVKFNQNLSNTFPYLGKIDYREEFGLGSFDIYDQKCGMNPLYLFIDIKSGDLDLIRRPLTF